MGRDDQELKEAKLGYKKAQSVGNHVEEARFANAIADILKRRGEYVEALRWLRVDYDISSKFLPQKQLLPTCQSLGEVYFRLEQFRQALSYQKKHLELAKDSNNIVEQQRASTQLGRTYYELFLKSENDHDAVRNAKKYFKLSMKLARALKENPPCYSSSSFLTEFIDAHNNIGSLEMDLDNVDQAEKILLQGLKICSDEEVAEYDESRTRLHHSLGCVYLELRQWAKARHHIEKDIKICHHIGHSQGEAKGYINLGELHNRVQKYDEAIHCYQKALDIAKSLEDEDALVNQINENLETVKEAVKVHEDLLRDEQKLKKLMRNIIDARGTPYERKCLLEQYACLDSLIRKSCTILAWPKHLEFAKRKKKVASELCDKEKLSDSYLAIGESHQKLRNFEKARKWYMKSWSACRSIGNLEGQAIAKINIGAVLDSSGDWTGALQAFEEGHKIAMQGNLPSVQLTALENMHYSYMVRFDNAEETRKLQLDIQNLKHLLNDEDGLRNMGDEYCSETETEGAGISDNQPNAYESPEVSKSAIDRPNIFNGSDDCVPLAKLIHQNKKFSKIKMSQLDLSSKQIDPSCNSGEASSSDLCKSCNQQSVGHKRVRVVISDDEAVDPDGLDQTRRLCKSLIEETATSGKDPRQDAQYEGTNEVKDVSHRTTLTDTVSAHPPVQIEESSYSLKSKNSNTSRSAASGSKFSGDVSGNLRKDNFGAVCNQLEDDKIQHIACKIGHDLIHVDMNSCTDGNYINTEIMKIEVACRYYLKLYEERRSKGLVPMIKHLKHCGKVLGSLEPVEELKFLLSGNIKLVAVISGWVPKRLMDSYVGCSEKLSETPNCKLLQKLYNLEVSEDEITVSGCGLQDITVSPFLTALQAHKTVAVLDMSHNLLGNETMEKVQLMFSSSVQKYGGLTLDLHCNRLGPTSLFQICECPVLFARLEVLNLSQNRLTDSCSSYLCTILENCKALYSLNIEQCSITSRTIQKVADVLHDGSALSHLAIGNNNPISGIAMVNLLSKLTSLKRFSELGLCGIRLNKPMVDGLCKLASSSTLSGLLLGGTHIGTDGAVRLTAALGSGPQELVKLDLSCCGISSHGLTEICTNIALIGGLLELNLGGNSIAPEACNSLRILLVNDQCCLKSINLSKCHIGLVGIVQLLQALSGNESLEELRLAENAAISQDRALEYMPESPRCSDNNAEVADSEDEEDTTKLQPNGSSASSSHRNNSAGSQLIQELASAIEAAEHLQLLDLSGNGLSSEVVELLYSSWSSPSSRCSSVFRHIAVDQRIVHFGVKEKKCCGVKPCCKRE